MDSLNKIVSVESEGQLKLGCRSAKASSVLAGAKCRPNGDRRGAKEIKEQPLQPERNIGSYSGRTGSVMSEGGDQK